MMQGGPLEHVIAAKAVALKEAMSPAFAEYAARVVRSARALSQGLADEGVRPVSGGTDSHLVLCDLRPLGIGGKEAEAACDRIGVAINKNAIPFDPQPPLDPSGIRVGTPGPATLGMDEPEMKEVAGILGEALRHPGDERVEAACRARVAELVGRFPVYPG
jgi:glycine hydroxymethyltransferase